VVADEVRNLAQRCAQAAKETSAKIEGSLSKTGQGVEISGKVAAALNDIVSKVRQVDELVTEVAGASREQTDGISQVNTAVGQMDKVTQSNAANAEETASAAQELNAQAELLEQSVAELLQLVGGRLELNRVDGNKPSGKVHSRAPRYDAVSAPTNGASNGHGHTRSASPASTVARRGNELPMDGDLKDF